MNHSLRALWNRPVVYFFEGGRTQQYHQVGNAVPPLLAKQLAEMVYDIFKRI